ncbi:MAG: Na+/H+ antiporter NhaA [Chloroflexota bacterium]|nr:MAG: Na+/H+ antiporter NhaA [Chloroflexota bacterium]
MATKTTSKLVQPVSEGDHVLGPDDAPITLVEYGDLECPYCRQVNPVIRELRERMGGRLRYVFRHFPIRSSHVHAQLAAEAVEAAGAQGKFWEMLEFILEHQEALELDHLMAYAAELELDQERFKQELEDHVYAGRVKDDFHDGVLSGVNGTPTFFINGDRYDGAWDLESLLEAIEKPLGVQVRRLAQEFMRIEASGGILLLISALIALLWANSAAAESYFHFWETELELGFGQFIFGLPLIEWINDGLMVIFFFVVGLEIKRQLTIGELSRPRRAILPLAAALGGMVVPAGIYLIFNAGGPGEPGWGIPVATDIAFTLGVLALLGSRAPLSIKIFFTALAIADDLGAILVLAIFYSSDVHWISLLIAAVILLVLIGLNRARVYSPLPYALLGIALWLAFLDSGIHPTIAGVLLAATIPTWGAPDTKALLAQCVSVLSEFELPSAQTANRTQVAAQTLETVADRMQSPAQRLEHSLLPWTTYLILPIFALANAGVTLKLDQSLVSMVSIGVVLGLVIGKSVGITLFTWLAVRLGLGDMPRNVSLRQVFSASWLAGIGFTMSLFIAGNAFRGNPELLDQAKAGILLASLLAGVIGYVLSYFTSQTFAETSPAEAVPATD